MSDIYRHVKTGGLYRRLMSAVNESDGTILVVYQSLDDGVRWVRPSREFYDGRFIEEKNYGEGGD